MVAEPLIVHPVISWSVGLVLLPMTFPWLPGIFTYTWLFLRVEMPVDIYIYTKILFVDPMGMLLPLFVCFVPLGTCSPLVCLSKKAIHNPGTTEAWHDGMQGWIFFTLANPKINGSKIAVAIP